MQKRGFYKLAVGTAGTVVISSVSHAEPGIEAGTSLGTLTAPTSLDIRGLDVPGSADIQESWLEGMINELMSQGRLSDSPSEEIIRDTAPMTGWGR